jgi:hypothetical protein
MKKQLKDFVETEHCHAEEETVTLARLTLLTATIKVKILEQPF